MITFKQLNVDANTDQINDELAKSLDKLPASIQIAFPRGNPIIPGCMIKAGDPLPDIKVDLFNQSKVKLNSAKIPCKGAFKTLQVQLDILKVEENNGKEETTLQVQYENAQFTKEHGYWFLRQEEGLKAVGRYRLCCLALNVTAHSRDNAFTFANGKALPRAEDIDFFVVAGPPIRFRCTRE